KGRRFDIALEVLAQRGLELVLPGWDVGHDLEGALLNFRSDRLAILEVVRLQPFTAQGFELVVLRPAEPSLVAIGAQHDVCRRVEQIGPGPTGREDVPAALLRR